MKKTFLSILSLITALVLPSCLEFETEVTLNKDGSGTITEEMVMGAQMISMMQMAAAQGGEQKDPLADMQDEAKLKEKAKAYGEGVTFLKSQPIKRDDGSKGVRVTYNVTDINKVTINPGSGMDALGDMKPGGDTAEKVEQANATFAYADNKLTITLPQPEAAAASEESSDEASEIDPNDPQMAMAAQMMKGMRIAAKVTIADGITKTNATFQDGNTITLMELDMDEVLKNPAGLSALQGIEKDPAGAAEAMKKIKGAKGETQEKVTVEVK